jgi:Family of unknown function (DUF5681)
MNPRPSRIEPERGVSSIVIHPDYAATGCASAAAATAGKFPARPTRQAGRFAPGQSGNPTGRPKVVAHIQELARQNAPEAIAALVEIATSGKI